MRVVATSNLSEDRLMERLLQSGKHNLHNIPIAEIGEVVDVEIGLVLKKITNVVRHIVINFITHQVSYTGCS